MTEDQDDASPPAPQPAGRTHLRAVNGPLAPVEPRPPLRLRREWKGLTVADLLRDDIAARLPGQVRSALHHLERADWQRADAAIPGELGRVIAGPRVTSRRRRSLTLLVAVAAVLAAAALSKWMGA